MALNFRGIHRAQPFPKGSPRTAMFAQYAGVDWPTGEPIILDSGMLSNLAQRRRRAPLWSQTLEPDLAYTRRRGSARAKHAGFRLVCGTQSQVGRGDVFDLWRKNCRVPSLAIKSKNSGMN